MKVLLGCKVHYSTKMKTVGMFVTFYTQNYFCGVIKIIYTMLVK